MTLEYKKLKEDICNLTQKHKLTIQENKKIVEELQAAIRNNKEITIELENVLQEKESYSNLCKKLEKIKTELQDTLEQRNCKIEYMTLEYKRLNEDFDNITQENVKLQEKLKKSLDDHKNITNELENELQEKTTSNECHLNTISKLRNEVERFIIEKSNISQEFDRVSQEKSDLLSNILSLEKEYSKYLEGIKCCLLEKVLYLSKIIFRFHTKLENMTESCKVQILDNMEHKESLNIQLEELIDKQNALTFEENKIDWSLDVIIKQTDKLASEKNDLAQSLETKKQGIPKACT
ncbi:hypothetical protein NQ317_017241 [Molorchus minor]|uniref:Uncharacterized protein n=1 Tax=Molorchus minor TaxID=1323400 RepID=A0ABQ9J177_9CUCU|nr:hypothetical protein NQ317_017241 [Molorchus minor]